MSTLLGISNDGYGIRNLLKAGRLAGFKVGHQWQIRRADFERFIFGQLSPAGRPGRWLKRFLFLPNVLDKSRQHPEEYYLADESFSGKVGKRVDLGEYQRTGKIPQDGFVEVHYQKTKVAEGEELIAVEPDELRKIPAQELAHWYQFQVNKIS